jgi:glycosyltransferase involved in cell wall biosynthesis
MNLAIIEDQVTPYRLPLFREIQSRVGELHVLFCSPRLQERQWDLPADLPANFEVLPNLALRLRRPPYGEPRTILFNPTLFPRLMRLRPDVVVGYAFSLPAQTAFAYAKLFGRGFVSWSTDTLHTERYLGPEQRLVRRWIIPRADSAVTPSKQGKAKFESYDLPAERISMAVQSADVQFFADGADAARRSGTTWAEAHGVSGTPIVYVGFLSELKGVVHLLRALPLVLKEVPSAELILAGDGPKRSALEDEAARLGLSDRVHFAGYVPQPEMPSLYASGKLFVFPTLQDTFGVVLSEAAACRLPIVSSPYAGAVDHYVEEGVNGHVVDPKDAAGLATAIADVLKDEARWSAMSDSSSKIANRYSVQLEADAFVAAAKRAYDRAH